MTRAPTSQFFLWTARPTPCGHDASEPGWTRWKAAALNIARAQRSGAVLNAIAESAESARDIEENAWICFCEGLSARSWCAKIARWQSVARAPRLDTPAAK